MISTIVTLVLLAIIVLLGASIVIAHRKQADAWAVLSGFSATLLAWLAFFKTSEEPVKPTVPDNRK